MSLVWLKEGLIGEEGEGRRGRGGEEDSHMVMVIRVRLVYTYSGGVHHCQHSGNHG